MSRFTIALLVLTMTAASAQALPLDERSMVAFTSEPNDLGTARNFFTLFPRSRCQQDLLDENHLLYFCEVRDGVQKFYLDLSYSDQTIVLSGVSLHGEK